jgi:CBS domain-containing protein
MKTADLMTTGVRTCRLQDKLSTAVQTMWDHDLGCLPVLDADGRVAGMITDRDVAMAVHFRGVPPWAVPVADAMAKIVLSAAPQDDLRRALELMARHQLRRLPIVDDDGRLAGMLALADLARACAATGRNALPARDLADLLAAVTMPRQPALAETIVVELSPTDEIRPAKRGTRAKKAPRTARSRLAKASKRGKTARAIR